MRKILPALAVLAATFLIQAPTSHAAEGTPYWCAQARDGAAQCTYFLIDQCLAAKWESSDCHVAQVPRINAGDEAPAATSPDYSFVVVKPVTEAVVLLLGESASRPQCTLAPGGAECTFFMLASCLETVQGSTTCAVMEPNYLVTTRLDAVAEPQSIGY